MTRWSTPRGGLHPSAPRSPARRTGVIVVGGPRGHSQGQSHLAAVVDLLQAAHRKTVPAPVGDPRRRCPGGGDGRDAGDLVHAGGRPDVGAVGAGAPPPGVLITSCTLPLAMRSA